jgi:hypothetical protein
MANNLPIEKKVAVVSALCEGMSIRATVRMTAVALNTVVNVIQTDPLPGFVHNFEQFIVNF